MTVLDRLSASSMQWVTPATDLLSLFHFESSFHEVSRINSLAIFFPGDGIDSDTLPTRKELNLTNGLLTLGTEVIHVACGGRLGQTQSKLRKLASMFIRRPGTCFTTVSDGHLDALLCESQDVWMVKKVKKITDGNDSRQRRRLGGVSAFRG
jgi:hypothetical protein